MKMTCLMSCAIAIAVALPAHAQAVRELSQAEVRSSVQSGGMLSLARIQAVVDSRISGEVVDVRAFEAGGLYYRVLIRQKNGKLVSTVLDARSGSFMRSDAGVAKSVQNAARKGSSLSSVLASGKAKSNNRGGNSGNNGNNGNGGGNSGGNSGGNGGGNSGGNGGGNSGGNGGGNSGGNGGGNSGGNSGGGKGGGKNK